MAPNETGDIRSAMQKELDKSAAYQALHIESARSGSTVESQHEYDVIVSWAGLVGGIVNISFTNRNLRFEGVSGGSAGGGFAGWGTAVFNFPLEELKGWEARFAIEGAGVIGGGAGVQLWAMDGRYIGKVSAGGFGIGGSFGGGQGRFK